MAKEFSLDQIYYLLEHEMVIVDDPNKEFMLGDVEGFNFMDLEYVGGVYLMIHEPTDEVIYVGESVNLGIRMYQHKEGVYNRSPIRTKITDDLGEAEAEKQINNEIKVQIFYENTEKYRKFFKYIFIGENVPKYTENTGEWS